MGQITRHHWGPMTVDVQLVRDLGDYLNMETAAPREEVVALRDDLIASGAPHHVWWEPYQVHDERGVETVDAYQRLVGWNRTRYGNVTVPADALCVIRNQLDADLLNGTQECEDLAEELRGELDDFDDPGTGEFLAEVEGSIASRGWCDRCEWCRTILLRDRCDLSLDAAGFDGGVYYRTFMRGITSDEE